MSTEVPRAKRHWVATVVSVWMFAFALNMLFYSVIMDSLFALRPGERHLGLALPLWGAGIIASVLDLLPTPGLLASLLAILHLSPVVRSAGVIVVQLSVLTVAVLLGVGLWRMREWARWGYASVCFLAVALWLQARVRGWATGHPPTLFGLVATVAEPILAVALLVFFVRGGAAFGRWNG